MIVARKIATKLDLDSQVERYLIEPVPMTEIQGYSIQRAAGDVTVLVVEIFVDPDRWEAKPDREISGFGELVRTFVRPDGTTYTKER
jgi:hypothetical protein